MASHNSYTPSAPAIPESYEPEDYRYPQRHGTSPPTTSLYGQQRPRPHPVPSHVYGGYSSFQPGTHTDVIRSFQAVDRDGSGYIEEKELQQALSSQYQRFSLRTIRLLMFLFKNPSDPLRIGPREFAALWSCLGEWRAIFQKFDKDRSGKIDMLELRDAFYSLGCVIPSSVLQVLISKYDDGSGRSIELNFDSFIECGMIIKGLTEKFKEKDTRRTGSATFTYDSFMSVVIPFLLAYD
ncbi:calcium-binding protein CML48 [Tripterygium wilfordii]|uniref:Calcium-binding protein CML48 n=1 Tax=Tripterygium wilfordii TaxID=458696 RepID=A0A7J7DF00_TRIWF|nr:probable calcium-binding protein CML48 [Tripterygium wilfordii]KAF5744874.1 calcium-binding protein CML48 [Tripterygium wilfordii]